jgi:RNA polymerase sigma-70 factor (ECF subfamily)
MTQFPETRNSLLMQVKDQRNAEAWEQFVQIYRPVIYRLARQKDLQDADAQDLTQQVLIAVASSIGKWESENQSTRFRHWLRKVAKNAIINALTRRPNDRAIGGSEIMTLMNEQSASAPETERLVEIEYRRELYLRAAELVQADVDPATWRVFEATVIDGQSIDVAADESGKSIGAIYAARSRIVRRLRKAVHKLEDAE